MSIDIERVRGDTPGCENVLHLNNAGASLMPAPVLAAQVEYLQREAMSGGYEAALEAGEQIEHTYDAVAALLGCDRDEVAVVENATAAWCAAFYSIELAAGDRILTAESEYGSNYIAYLQVARRTGAVIEVVPSDEHGQISVGALEDMLDERVKLISLPHVPTNSGLVNPVEEVGRIARRAGVLYLLDACQAAGQIPLDVERIGCDMLTATGRKYVRGPRGTGFLYVRRSLIERLEPPHLDVHAASWVAPDRYQVRPDARRFENWESNYAAKIGLGVAIDYALDVGLEAIEARVVALAAYLRDELATVPGVEVADIGQRRCGIVTFTVAHGSATALREALRAQGIHVSVTGRGSTLLDMDRRGLSELARASVHYYNTAEEIERFCRALRALL